jgi:peptidyl-prolyl cis-trans isomerase C
MINRELLYRDALRKGLDQDDRIQYKIENYRRNLLVNELLKQELEGMAIVTDEEVWHYYTSNQEQFTKESLEASHILLKNKDNAEMVLRLINRGENFSEMAKKFSIGPSRDIGGNLGIVTRGQMVPELEDALFSLEKTGDISPIVKTEFGYHIIRLDKPKTTSIQPFEEVEGMIQEILTEEKEVEFLEEFVENLKQGIEIEINEELLTELE